MVSLWRDEAGDHDGPQEWLSLLLVLASTHVCLHVYGVLKTFFRPRATEEDSWGEQSQQKKERHVEVGLQIYERTMR